MTFVWPSSHLKRKKMVRSRILSMRQGKISIATTCRWLDISHRASSRIPWTCTHRLMPLWMGCVRSRLTYRNLSYERAEPAKLEKTFSIFIRGDYRVIKSYTKPTIFTVAQYPGPEPMEIDVGSRQRATTHASDVFSERLMVCFRRKPRHRASDWRAPSSISAHVVRTMKMLPRSHVQKLTRSSRCREPYWL